MASNNDDDPVMKMYEAQAMLIEKEAEMEEMRRFIERLQLENQNKAINLNNQGLVQRVSRLEQELTTSRADNIQIREQMARLQLNLERVTEENIQRNQERQMVTAQLEAMQLAINQLNRPINRPREENRNIPNNVAEQVVRNNENSSALILCDTAAVIYHSKIGLWKQLKMSFFNEQIQQKRTLPGRESMNAFGVAVVNGEIYIFGGRNNNYKRLSHTYKLENGGKWKQLAYMNEARANIQNSSIVFQNEIWVIGGNSDLTSVEKYNIFTDEWTFMPETNLARDHSAAAVLNGKIYVSGGGRDAKRSVEVFEPDLQKWTTLCLMPIGLCGHCMLAFNGNLILLGGFSTMVSNSVWKLNPNDPNKKWIKMPNLIVPRYEFGVTNTSNDIIIFGGTSANNMRLDSSEIFDGNKWTEGPGLPHMWVKEISYIPLSQSFEEQLLQQFTLIS